MITQHQWVQLGLPDYKWQEFIDCYYWYMDGHFRISPIAPWYIYFCAPSDVVKVIIREFPTEAKARHIASILELSR